MLVDKNKIIEGDSAQFNLVLSTHFLSADENTEKRLDHFQKNKLADCLYHLFSGTDEWQSGKSELLIQALEKNSGLSFTPIERAEFKFNVIALDDFRNTSHLDDPVSHLLSQCRYHLLINSLVEKQFLLSSHPLKQLVDFIHDNLLGFDARFGKALMPIYNFVETLVNDLLNTPWDDTKRYRELMMQANEELKQLTQRFFMISDRMILTEEGHLRAKQAKQTVNQFIYSIVRGVEIPEDLSTCLQTQIVDELRILLVTQGVDSPYWLRVKKSLSTLVALYQPVDVPDKKTKTLWKQLPEEIDQLFDELGIHNDQIAKCLDKVKFDFYHLEQGHQVDGLTPVVLPDEAFSPEAIAFNSESEFSSTIQSFQEGQWFLYEDQGQVQRVYLSLKLKNFDQYLFINMLGQKVISLDFNDFSDALVNGSFTPLSQNGICIQLYSRAVDKILQDFYERYENHMQARQQAEEAALKESLKQREIAVDPELEGLVVETDVPPVSSHPRPPGDEEPLEPVETHLQDMLLKESLGEDAVAHSDPIHEATSLDTDNALPPLIEDAGLLSQSDERSSSTALNSKKSVSISERNSSKASIEIAYPDALIKETRLALDLLSMGSRVDYLCEGHTQLVRAKLAVKLNATKRFVFIDHDGLTVLDIHRADLIELVLTGRVVLLDVQQQFNDKLQTVVASLKEVSPA